MGRRDAADRLLRRALARLHRGSDVFVSEYPLAPRARWGWDGAPVLGTLSERLGASDYDAAVAAAVDLLDWGRGIPRRAEGGREPCWENDWWGTIDALYQCAMLRARAPALYLEVGSGFSTLFARRAVRDFGLRTKIVSIDPAPRAEVDACCDEVIRMRLQDARAPVFERLAPGDVVLVDCSHVAMMDSDSTVFLLEILPSLPAGVLVGIDDIFLPWDYPPTWAARMYGEQYLLAAMLLGGGAGIDVTFPGWWLTDGTAAYAERLAPVWPVVQNRFGRHATSFWFEWRGTGAIAS